jgi:DNA repair protein RecO (recombination protein O)
MSGKTESLLHIDAIIDYKESRSLQMLRDAEIINSYRPLKLDMNRFPYAMGILELITKIFENEQEDALFFTFVLEMINALEESKFPENVFLYFLLKLSSYLGFKPQLQICNGGSDAVCSEKVFVSMTNGQVYCASCTGGSEAPLPLPKSEYFFLKNLQNVNFRRVKNWESHSTDSRRLTRSLVSYINFHLENNISIDALQLLD